MNYPKLSETLGLTLLAGLFIALAWVPEIWRGKEGAVWAFTRFFLVIVAGTLLLFAIFSILDLFVYRANLRLTEYQKAQATTERVKILDIIQRMGPEQLAAVSASGVSLDFIAGSDGSVIASRLMTPRGEVPVSFFRDFMELSGEANTAPVRAWSEGTQDRLYARWLTDFFVDMGWATPAAGNQSAKWTNRAAAEAVLRAVQVVGIGEQT